MIRASIGSLIVLGVLLSSAVGQAPAEERVGEREAQLKAQIAAAQAEIERLNRVIAELEQKRAESLRRIKTLEESIAEIRGTKAASRPPLLFSPEIERAMLHDAQPRLPRELRLNPFDLPERFELPRRLPPVAPRR